MNSSEKVFSVNVFDRLKNFLCIHFTNTSKVNEKKRKKGKHLLTLDSGEDWHKHWGNYMQNFLRKPRFTSLPFLSAARVAGKATFEVNTLSNHVPCSKKISSSCAHKYSWIRLEYAVRCYSIISKSNVVKEIKYLNSNFDGDCLYTDGRQCMEIIFFPRRYQKSLHFAYH